MSVKLHDFVFVFFFFSFCCFSAYTSFQFNSFECLVLFVFFFWANKRLFTHTRTYFLPIILACAICIEKEKLIHFPFYMLQIFFLFYSHNALQQYIIITSVEKFSTLVLFCSTFPFQKYRRTPATLSVLFYCYIF